jgi:hypothetical protein
LSALAERLHCQALPHLRSQAQNLPQVCPKSGACSQLAVPQNLNALPVLPVQAGTCHLLALPQSGWLTIPKLTYWVCGTNPSTLEQKLAPYDAGSSDQGGEMWSIVHFPGEMRSSNTPPHAPYKDYSCKEVTESVLPL